MSIQIRQISVEETYPLRHTIMWPNKPLAYIQLKDDPLGTHFGLFIHEELVSVCSLFIAQNSGQFRKLATLTKEQGKGYASALILHIIDYSKNKNIGELWCNARANKTKFYSRFGFIKTDNQYTKEGINFIVMKIAL